MRYRYHLCHLVFVHPTGVSSSRYPSPGASVTHALSRHGSLLKLRQCKCRVLEAIYNCIFLPVMSIPMLPRKCQTTRSAVPVYRCGVSLLYIKQLYTLPSVSRCQPPKSCRTLSILFICKRASIRYTSVRLSSKRPRQGLGRTFSLSSSYA